MHKCLSESFLGCGIDVSAAQLVVACESASGRWRQRNFPNCARGHQALILLGVRQIGFVAAQDGGERMYDFRVQPGYFDTCGRVQNRG